MKQKETTTYKLALEDQWKYCDNLDEILWFLIYKDKYEEYLKNKWYEEYLYQKEFEECLIEMH